MPSTTLLDLGVLQASDYALRGLTQSLTPIAQATQLRRTVNGGLRDVSVAAFQKYASTITCDDHVPPALDGVFPGMQVTVKCVQELSYASGGSPQRPVVAGSSRTEAGFVFYRPQLTMLVVGWAVQTDEYNAAVGWSLSLEEV